MAHIYDAPNVQNLYIIRWRSVGADEAEGFGQTAVGVAAAGKLPQDT